MPGRSTIALTRGGSLIRVAGIQDRTPADGPHHRDVFEAHLRRAVLADADPAVGADQMKGSVRKRGHADLVERPGEEGRERGGHDPLAQDGQPHGG